MKYATLLLLVCAGWLPAAPRLHMSQEQIAPGGEIQIVLDKEACPADRIGKEAATEWLKIAPMWAGKTVWKEANVLSFEPTEPPVIGTKYTFTLAGKHIHLDGSEVPIGKLGDASTPGFRIDYATWLHRYEPDWSPRTGVWFLRFNDAVDASQAGRHMSYRSKSGRTVAAKVRQASFGELKHRGYVTSSYTEKWQAALTGEETETELKPEFVSPTGLLVEPAEPLPVGKGWDLVIGKGVVSGGRSLGAETVRHIGDIDPMTLKKVKAVTVADEGRKIVLDFSQKLPADLSPDWVSVEPEVKDLRLESHGDEVHVLGDFSTMDRWTVSVGDALTSKDGRTLDKATVRSLMFEHLGAELGLASQDETQLASGARIYRVSSINVGSVKLRIKRLEGEQLIRAQQGYRHYSGRGPDGHSLGRTGLVPYELMGGETVFDQEIELSDTIDTSRQLVIDWDAVLAGEAKPYRIGKPGEPKLGPRPAAAFFIELVGTPLDGAKSQKKPAKKPAVQALVQLTDLGMAWKITDNEARVLAFSCDTGQPLPGVLVEVFGEDAKKIGDYRTDASGMAVLPRDTKGRHLRATLAGDQFSAPFDASMPTVGLWRFPVRYSWNEPPVVSRRAFLFTDRSLYRPGEMVHLKGVIRRQDGNDIGLADCAGAKLRLRNPTGRNLIERDLEISDLGSFDMSFRLPPETTGNHQIWVEWPDELAAAKKIERWTERSHKLQNAQFMIGLRVEEFRRNAFEITHEVETPAPGATEVGLDLTAGYYHGQAVAEGNAGIWTRVAERNFYPERYRDYLFGDHREPDFGYWFHYFGYRWQDDYGARNSTSESSDEVLDAEGRMKVVAKIPEGEFPMARTVSIETTVTDANQQTLSKTSTLTVHPSSTYVGIKRLDRLVRVGDRVSFELVAVTPEGEKVNGPVDVTAKLTREVNEQVRMLHQNGRGAVRNEARIEELGESSVSLDPGKAGEFVFEPTQSGLHTIELRGMDAEGRPFATASAVHVYGADEYPWAYEDHMRIKLVAEKKHYKPGDTARVLVLSPIEGKALVTVEREDVSRSFLVDLKATEPLIEIPLDDGDAPNCFVSVLVIKGAQESLRKHKEPQLRLGYCELTVENVRDRLQVELDEPEGGEAGEFLPGAEIEVSGRVVRADGSPAAGAEVTVYAEDEGTLAVVGYDTPDPMSFFYDPRLLRVECGTSLGNFIPESPDEQTFYNKGFFIGGGDGEWGGQLEIPRSDFDPCAFWKPSVIADAEGRFRFSSKLPDTLTRYRLMAVAHHEAARFGHSDDEFIVNKPVMLEPQVPRFAHEGDRLRLQALLQNASGRDGTWEVSILPDPTSSSPVAALASGAEPKATVELAAGESATVAFPIEFRSTGKALIRWRAVPVMLPDRDKNPDFRRLSDTVESSFEVEYPMPLLRQSRLISFRREGGSRDLLDGLDPKLLEGRGSVELEASRSLLLEAGGAVDYLLRYPYGCIEQTTSALIPWLAVEKMRAVSPELATHSPEEVKAVVQSGIDRLVSMQSRDGGFGYWNGRSSANRWSSSYAGLGLILASEQGHVPAEVLESLSSYLIKQLNKSKEESTSWDHEIAARDLWVLALVGKPQEAHVNKMLGKVERLNGRARSLLALSLVASDRVEDARALMLNQEPCVVADNSWMRWKPDQGLKLMAWSAIDSDSDEATTAIRKLIESRNPYGHWRTTWVNAWSLLGLAAYADSAGDLEPTSVTLAVAGARPDSFVLDTDHPMQSRRFALHDGLGVEARTDGETYVRVKLAAKPKIAPVQPVAANGMEVTRFYKRVLADGSTEPLDVPRIGDLIRVDLRVTLPTDDARYLVVEDRLPSIFEAINNSFKSQAAPSAAGRTSEKQWSISHSEVRDDRVMFFFDRIYSRGTRTLSYLARCTMAGTAYAPSAKSESMYDPDNTALSASRIFTVEAKD